MLSPAAAAKLWVCSIFSGKPSSETLKVSTPKLRYPKWVSRAASSACRTSYPLSSFLGFPVSPPSPELSNSRLRGSCATPVSCFLHSGTFPSYGAPPPSHPTSFFTYLQVSIKVSILFMSLFQKSYWDWTLPSKHRRWCLTAWLTRKKHWATRRTARHASLM